MSWVSFQEVKAQVTFEQVFSGLYPELELTRKGESFVGKCPLHEGDGKSFNASVEKGAFHCFSCNAKGNVIDFVAQKEGIAFREAALLLKERFLGGEQKKKPRSNKSAAAKTKAEDKPAINPPLGFELKVDSSHEYGRSRGLSEETIEAFGAGLCVSRGKFAGRYVVPIRHPFEGYVCGYIGRSIDGSEPKYLLPGSDKGFRRSNLLFNLHRVQDSKVLVVEGVFDCMRMSAWPCVALLGSSLSEWQERTLCQRFEKVVLCLDGDESGRAGMQDCLMRLSKKVFVRAVRLGDGMQPDGLSDEQQQELFGWFRS